MSDMQSSIEQQVMASVGVLYTAKALVGATALKAYTLVASVWALGALVWVARVEENFLQALNGGVLAVGNFVLAALVHTSTVVQLVLLVAVFALGSLAVDLVRKANRSRYAF